MMRRVGFVYVLFVVLLLMGVWGLVQGMNQASAQGQWMTLMLNCGGVLENSGASTLHTSEGEAKARGDAELASGRFDIAYVEERDGEFYRLRWVKTTSDCYDGSFREWSNDF